MVQRRVVYRRSKRLLLSPVVRADLDGDGIVGLNDFLMLLANWT